MRTGTRVVLVPEHIPHRRDGVAVAAARRPDADHAD